MKFAQAKLDIARGATIFRGLSEDEFAPVVEAAHQ